MKQPIHSVEIETKRYATTFITWIRWDDDNEPAHNLTFKMFSVRHNDPRHAHWLERVRRAQDAMIAKARP